MALWRRFEYSHFCRRFGVAVLTIDRARRYSARGPIAVGGARRTLCREERGEAFGILEHGPSPTFLRHWLYTGVRRCGKKRRLVVEVESLASSRKKITTRRREGVCRRRKKGESRRTFNKNWCDLLTAITHTEILCALCITKLINNLTRKQNYESKTVDVSMM